MADLLEARLDRLEECQRLSTLPEAPYRAFAEHLVADLYRKAVLTTAA